MIITVDSIGDLEILAISVKKRNDLNNNYELESLIESYHPSRSYKILTD